MTPTTVTGFKSDKNSTPTHSRLIRAVTMTLCFFALFFSTAVFAQTSKDVHSAILMSYDGFLKNSQYASEHARVFSLTNDLHSAVYLNGGQSKVYGSGPVCLYTDLVSLTKNDIAVPSQLIEMVIIRIASLTELKQPINFVAFENYTKLRYIFILSDVEITDDAIAKLAKGNMIYTILYKTAKPS